MRPTLLVAATLLLSACGRNDQAATTQNADQGMTADSIVSNDVTAIDAVTADDANMAAESALNIGSVDRTGSSDPADIRPSAQGALDSDASTPTDESNSTAPMTNGPAGNSQ